VKTSETMETALLVCLLMLFCTAVGETSFLSLLGLASRKNLVSAQDQALSLGHDLSRCLQDLDDLRRQTRKDFLWLQGNLEVHNASLHHLESQFLDCSWTSRRKTRTLARARRELKNKVEELAQCSQEVHSSKRDLEGCEKKNAELMTWSLLDCFRVFLELVGLISFFHQFQIRFWLGDVLIGFSFDILKAFRCLSKFVRFFSLETAKLFDRAVLLRICDVSSNGSNDHYAFESRNNLNRRSFFECFDTLSLSTKILANHHSSSAFFDRWIGSDHEGGHFKDTQSFFGESKGKEQNHSQDLNEYVLVYSANEDQVDTPCHESVSRRFLDEPSDKAGKIESEAHERNLSQELNGYVLVKEGEIEPSGKVESVSQCVVDESSHGEEGLENEVNGQNHYEELNGYVLIPAANEDEIESSGQFESCYDYCEI